MQNRQVIATARTSAAIAFFLMISFRIVSLNNKTHSNEISSTAMDPPAGTAYSPTSGEDLAGHHYPASLHQLTTGHCASRTESPLAQPLFGKLTIDREFVPPHHPAGILGVAADTAMDPDESHFQNTIYPEHGRGSHSETHNGTCFEYQRNQLVSTVPNRFPTASFQTVFRDEFSIQQQHNPELTPRAALRPHSPAPSAPRSPAPIAPRARAHWNRYRVFYSVPPESILPRFSETHAIFLAIMGSLCPLVYRIYSAYSPFGRTLVSRTRQLVRALRPLRTGTQDRTRLSWAFLLLSLGIRNHHSTQLLSGALAVRLALAPLAFTSAYGLVLQWYGPSRSWPTGNALSVYESIFRAVHHLDS